MVFSALITFIIHLVAGTNLPTPALYQITKPVDHAEGPTWDYRKNLLYFVDIHAGNIYSYDYYSRELHSIFINGEVTPVIPSKYNPNLLLIGANRSVLAVEWDGKKSVGGQKRLTTVSKQFPTSRFNDGKADKQGRLWFGTMGFEDSTRVTPNHGILYKITKTNLANPSVQIAPVNISNGLAWDKSNKKFYYIDTPTRRVVEYNYNDQKGTIRNPRVIFDLTQYSNSVITGYPDGMTIDCEDNLWIALYGGGAVIKVSSKTGQLLQIIAIPALAVTSVAWGGPNMNILFVTTSRFRLTPKQRRLQPAAGSVFAVTGLRARGLPPFEADIIEAI